VISESTRDDLVRRGIRAERIEVQHPGIRRPVIPLPPIESRPRQVVYLGRLEPYKNVDVLLRAVARISQQVPDVALVVIGRGSDRPRLERIAAEVGVKERTRFEGFVADDERDRLLATSRVCVCPSSKEGWGLTVIESNALATPNVATDAPGLRDSVRDGETGFLVAERDEEAFASRMAELLLDDAVATRMSRAALDWSQRFEWDHAAVQMEAALDATLRGA